MQFCAQREDTLMCRQVAPSHGDWLSFNEPFFARIKLILPLLPTLSLFLSPARVVEWRRKEELVGVKLLKKVVPS
jgi:hypothetical protein